MLYDLNNISVKAREITADDLDKAVIALKKDNNLIGAGQYFIDTQEKYDINAIVLLAMACLESGFGNSKLAREKNNLFGIHANDSLKGTANYGDYFATKEDCVDFAGYKLRKQYLELDKKASWCYADGNTDIWSIGEIWSSNPKWGDLIEDLCERLTKNIDVEEVEPEIDYKKKYFEAMDYIAQIRNITDKAELKAEMEIPNDEY